MCMPLIYSIIDTRFGARLWMDLMAVRYRVVYTIRCERSDAIRIDINTM